MNPRIHDPASEEDSPKQPIANPVVHTPWQRADWLLLLGITLLAAILRFYQLGSVPPGFQFDEAFNAIDAELVLQGTRPLFLPANGGREVLYTYFQAGLITLFGASVWSFRLASALWGIAGVAASFILFRTILRRDARLIAAFSALAMAISYWHLHFSHFGIRVITMPVIFSALFGFYWMATRAPTPRRRVIYFVLAGVMLGLSVYSNPTGRLAPIVLIAWTLILLWRNRGMRSWRPAAPLVGLVITAAVAFVVFLPLGITFVQNPEFFFGHAAEVSIFAERVSEGRSALAVLADNALHVLGMFSFYGDREWTHGIPGRPLLDWVIAIPFYIGIVIWARRLFGKERAHDADGDALWLLACWAVVMLAPSVLSDSAPNYSRTLPSLPATVLPIGLGLAWLVRLPLLAHSRSRQRLGYALAGVILAVSLAWTARDYFVRFPHMEPAYYAYDVDKADALAILQARSDENQIFLSPLWAEHAPVRWIREGSAIKTLDPSTTIVLPADKGALYAFTGEEQRRADDFAERIAERLGSKDVEAIYDKYGKALLWLVTLDRNEVAALAETRAPLDARFDDAPTLLAATPAADGSVTLHWRSEAFTFRNLTQFIHLIDQDGTRVAQVDRLPGDGSYETPTWSAGEQVLDQLMPEPVTACIGGEPVRILTGWYEYAADGARRPRLGAPGDAVVAGEMTMPVRPLREEEIAPALPLDTYAGPLALIGYTLHHAEQLQAGAPFELDLYYRAQAETGDLPFVLGSDSTEFATFAEGTLLPNVAAKPDGRTYCQRIRMRVPLSISTTGEGGLQSGAHTLALVLGSDGQRIPIGITLEVAGEGGAVGLSTAAAEIDTLASLADQIALVASTIGAPLDASLPVTLTWQALAEPAYPYKAFVQVLAPDGSFVAGSDTEPGTVPTQRWIRSAQQTSAHLLALPADLPAGDYELVAGMYDTLSLARLPAHDEQGERLKDDLILLGTVRLGE